MENFLTARLNFEEWQTQAWLKFRLAPRFSWGPINEVDVLYQMGRRYFVYQKIKNLTFKFSIQVDSFSNTKFQIQRRLSRRWSSLSKKLQCCSGHPTGLIRRLKALWGLKHWRANVIGGGDTAQSGYNLRIGDLRTLNQCYWRGNGETVRLGTLWVHFERYSVGYADTLDAAQQEGLTTQTHT